MCTEALWNLFFNWFELLDPKTGLSIIENGRFFELETRRLRTCFGVSSGFLCRFFGNPSGAPEGFRKDSRRIPEENIKKTGNRYEEFKNTRPGISQNLFHRGSVHTLHFYFFTTPFLWCQQGIRHWWWLAAKKNNLNHPPGVWTDRCWWWILFFKN